MLILLPEKAKSTPPLTCYACSMHMHARLCLEALIMKATMAVSTAKATVMSMACPTAVATAGVRHARVHSVSAFLSLA